jgi:hypothetical protein
MDSVLLLALAECWRFLSEDVLLEEEVKSQVPHRAALHMAMACRNAVLKLVQLICLSIVHYHEYYRTGHGPFVL